MRACTTLRPLRAFTAAQHYGLLPPFGVGLVTLRLTPSPRRPTYRRADSVRDRVCRDIHYSPSSRRGRLCCGIFLRRVSLFLSRTWHHTYFLICAAHLYVEHFGHIAYVIACAAVCSAMPPRSRTFIATFGISFGLSLTCRVLHGDVSRILSHAATTPLTVGFLQTAAVRAVRRICCRLYRVTAVSARTRSAWRIILV